MNTNNENTCNVPVKGIVRAKLNEGFVVRFEDLQTCFVPIGNLGAYTDEERFDRYEAIEIGDEMEVVTTGASRRPIASEIKAMEYRAEQSLSRGAEVEFYVVTATPDGVAVRLLAPASAAGVSAYIHRGRLDLETYELLLQDSGKCADERVGRLATIASITRNERKRLSIKLAA
jgi:ribosomal protein S1